jgi:hypothetical protein
LTDFPGRDNCGRSDVSIEPAVSVVIPAYNQSSYLRRAISSALDQSWADLELVVVDDGSTDDTRAVCDSFAADRRLRYVYQDNDGTSGLGARNRAMLEARGEWIALLDQDDVWAPTKLSRQLDAAAAEPGAGLVFCLARFIDHDGTCTGEQRRDVPEGDVYPKLLVRNWYYASTGMFRRRLLRVAGLPTRGAGSGDRVLWLAIARHTRALVVREHLCDYRFHAQNYSMSLLERPDGAFRHEMLRWRAIATHVPLVSMDRPDHRAALALAQRRNSRRFFEVALAAARRGDPATRREAERMARVAAPELSGRPWVRLRRWWRMLGARLGRVHDRSGAT